MPSFLQKTLGGLSPRYYVRQLFFSLFIGSFAVFALLQGKGSIQFGMLSFAILSTLLYPYSRFVYESIVDFIIGNNVFYINALVMLSAKLITMAMCWAFAIFIAPIGLAYLYYHHSKVTS